MGLRLNLFPSLIYRNTPTSMYSLSHCPFHLPQGEHDKAATLYMKGGKLSKAVEMCFAAKLFDVLQMIADDLEANQDPGLYTRCAEFFLQVQGGGGRGGREAEREAGVGGDKWGRAAKREAVGKGG